VFVGALFRVDNLTVLLIAEKDRSGQVTNEEKNLHRCKKNSIVRGLDIMDKDTILVADDHSGCRELLVMTLEEHGFRTISATCGLEAVKLATTFQPRLVLMDLSMPYMNGYEAAQAIHSHPRGREIPIVAVSGDIDYRRALEAGFIACLLKPWREEALLQMVTNVLARKVSQAA
jgi:CheY-like chemotaxis protein